MQFDRDVRCMNITRSVANLCRNLGIASVAEGVESLAIAEALHAFGVRLAQGYHFSRPLRLHDAIAFAEASETGVEARRLASA
jgi:EAL domain-containing protein (putative c-di-GMP-specific phosphodiesterase class I)